MGELSDIRGRTQNDKLEEIYTKFNVNHPEDYKGHSLSVSDIVVLHKNGRNSAHFVDSFGFTGLPAFMRTLESTIENNALNMAGQGQETAQGRTPETGTNSPPAFYAHTLSYAIEHGETDAYRASYRVNEECKFAIEETILHNFDGMRLNHDIALPLAEKYGSERMAYVLANTIQCLSWDGRFSMANKAWAQECHIEDDVMNGASRNQYLIVISHPAVLDGFIDMFRRDVLEQDREKAAMQESEQDKQPEKPAKQDEPKQSEQPVIQDAQDKPEQDKRPETQAEQGVVEQPEQSEILSETPEIQAEQSGSGQPQVRADEAASEQTVETSEIEDGDELIDLGDETDQVLADLKKSIESRQDAPGQDSRISDQAAPEKKTEKELAFQITDNYYISIQETDGGYDYSIIDAEYRVMDGGVLDNPDVSIHEALEDIVSDLHESYGIDGIGGPDGWMPMDYDGLMEKVEAAERVELRKTRDKEQDKPARPSLKARIAEIKARTAAQESEKNVKSQEKAR